MKKVLMSSSMGPYQTGWGEDINDLFAARLTRNQGAFTLRSYFPSFALFLIAENIDADTTILEWPTEKVLRRELKKGYDYFAIQVKSVYLVPIAKMVKIAKEVAPKTKIVLGGYGVNHVFNVYPRDTGGASAYLKENADFVCFEEGVGFFRKLLGQDANAPISQVRQPVFESSLRGAEYFLRLPLSSTLVALGCPNACEFCNTSHFFKFKKITACPPEEACASLKTATARMKGMPALFNMIWDEDFLIDRDYVLRLGELLQKENLIGKVNMFCFGSIRSISQYTVEELARCGVGVIWIGVESKFSDQITESHNFTKRIGRDVKEVFDELHKYGILIIGSNIIGLDFHNHENIIEDLDFFVSLKPDLYQVSPLRPCPGTMLYERLTEDGRIHENFGAEDTMLWSDNGLIHPTFKYGEIQKYFDLAHKKLMENNGPTVLSVMDVMLQGYETMRHSKDPFLQARAERCHYFCKKLVGGVVYASRELAPSAKVRERAIDVEERYHRLIGGYTLPEKAIQRIVYQVLKPQENRQPEENPAPDYSITRYKGLGAEPKVVERQHPVRDAMVRVSAGVLRKVLDLEYKNVFPIKLKDIDDFPVEFKSMEVEGNRMSYVDEGEGEVLLMLHGNPTWSFLYRHFIKDLKKDYRCIAPDHLGYGLSDKPAGADYSMEAHIRRLGIFVEKLGLEKVTLICQDWGGIIGLSYAARNKEKFSRLIPMNTTGFLPRSPLEFARCLGAWAFPYLWSYKIPVLGKKMAMDWNVFLEAGMRLGTYNTAKMMHKKAMLGYKYPFQRVEDRLAIMKSVRQVPMGPYTGAWGLLRDTEKKLEGWDVRTRVIWGMKDPVFVPWFIEKFEELLPNHAPSLKIPTAGHFLQDDEPDIIIRGIRELLAEERLLPKAALAEARAGKKKRNGKPVFSTAPAAV
ncbi:MAG: alpha/beta fold hydrolase [Deltaproteobacteria bacterium]|nr:alpha/beta fold hydrolase [Deltaproteobacteria bacterium]